jgi:hypothetical protein
MRQVVVVFTLLSILAACGDDTTPPPTGDSSRVDGGTHCATATDCDDGTFCNGAESCSPTGPGDGCTAGTPPCAADEMCDEGADRCLDDCDTMGDLDEDGHVSVVCGGDDCDDSDILVYAGATETCDPMNRDEDCDPTTFGVRDGDGDLFADDRCCNGDTCGNDCDDSFPGAHPGLAESCDSFDNDCDDNVDEGVLTTFYPDEDGDSFGTDDPAAVTMTACMPPAGYSSNMLDCDDTTSDVNPVRPEICDAAMVDENCDEIANPDCTCTVGMSRGCSLPGRCAAGTELCMGGSWGPCSLEPELEVCNDEDDDCDGTIDETLRVVCYADMDNDTYPPPGATSMMSCPVDGRASVGGCPTGSTNRVPAPGAHDCNDGNSTINPSAMEICIPDTMALDENCNGMVDEGVAATCYTDNDNDTYAPMGSVATSRCRDPARASVGFCPVLYTNRAPTVGNRDCVDSNFSINPGATEICDGANDENCNGMTDEGCSCMTGSSRACPLPGICAMGMQTCTAGMWGLCSIMPGVEACDGSDNDCDGTTDEGVTTTCYTDADNDTYAPFGATTTAVCGACGGGLTFRAPTGMNIDCNDMQMQDYPGAPERCDRRDNDCSSGGTIQLIEDRDGDMHTDDEYTGCDGGFPKDDCGDYDDRMYTGQTEAFRTPNCGLGTPCTCAGPPSRPGCMGGGVPFCVCSSTSTSQWDFNCNGTVTRRIGCLSICGPPFPNCGLPGPTTDTGECGQAVTSFSSCGTCGSCTTTTAGRPVGRPCY